MFSPQPREVVDSKSGEFHDSPEKASVRKAANGRVSKESREFDPFLFFGKHFSFEKSEQKILK